MNISLQTSRGTNIRNQIYLDKPRFYYKKKDDHYKLKYPHAILRSRGTHKYNCFGLNFANRRTWIDDINELSIIFEDDEYKIASFEKVRPGDLIVYKYNDLVEHTGVVIHIEDSFNVLIPIIISKWADCGEFIHPYKHCPYNDCNNIEFWTERKKDV